MREVYRKRGSVVRYDHGTFIHVSEAGQAVEEDGLFRCEPWRDADRLPEIDDAALREVVRNVRSSVSVTIERLVATDGLADHELGERTWRETSRRVHLSLVNGRHRVLLDEGSFDVREIERLAGLFGRIGKERDAPPRIRLAPRVMAAITPMVAGVAPPNVTIEQAAGGLDGKGLPIEHASAPPWPNWYRPSYRVRPHRAPLNMTVRCSVTAVDASLPQGVALLAPPRGLEMRLLCVDGTAVFPATLRLARIDAISTAVAWFPVETGVWAGEAEVA
ncbi:MAG TPA: hypothetical protein VM779_13850 [Thermoanaerobaculia bacterium]|nr:hypothetical protein [Thermoanaerobaculia bacterium]